MKDYIERAAVEKFIEDGLNNPDKNRAFGHDAIEIMAEVHYMPAADVVEVRHGYWIYHHSGGSFCFACKRWVPYSHHPKYCETCGARMDKEVEHEAD